MKKKILSAVLCVMMAGSLAACADCSLRKL